MVTWGGQVIVLQAWQSHDMDMIDQWIDWIGLPPSVRTLLGLIGHVPFSDTYFQKMLIEERIRNIAKTDHQQCGGFGVLVVIDGFLFRILVLC